MASIWMPFFIVNIDKMRLFFIVPPHITRNIKLLSVQL